MKRLWRVLGLCVCLMMGLVGCIIDSDSEIDPPETDYNAISIARSMAGVEAIEGVARNPECMDGFRVIAEESALGRVSEDGNDLAKVRMTAYQAMYESIARQPEAIDEIREITELAVGLTKQRDPSLRDEEVEIARLHSFSELYTALARQPAASELLVAAALHFAGGPKATLTDEEAKARLESFGVLFEAIGRNPEATDKLLGAVETLTGSMDYLSKPLSDAERCGRQSALIGFYESYARNPEAELLFEKASRVLLGFEMDLPSTDN
ncbi:hypothetical protein [Desulfoluna sp.]|uniref:hypothetical protein n=1 Tax=Desulfoluna sp. TaxID=2045199 RepID=UPI00261972B3|nr:hypothetical protein [Desulfoluna sp.]